MECGNDNAVIDINNIIRGCRREKETQDERITTQPSTASGADRARSDRTRRQREMQATPQRSVALPSPSAVTPTSPSPSHSSAH